MKFLETILNTFQFIPTTFEMIFQTNGKIKFHNGYKWYLNGKLHREDGPAIEFSDGTKKWFLNGQLHRINGPAIEYPNGSKYWYLNGLRHRTDGPDVEFANGQKEWYLNSKRHRTDGPAEVYGGDKSWYRNGKLHRENGPAIEWANGYKAWFLNGQKVDPFIIGKTNNNGASPSGYDNRHQSIRIVRKLSTRTDILLNLQMAINIGI